MDWTSFVGGVVVGVVIMLVPVIIAILRIGGNCGCNGELEKYIKIGGRPRDK